MEARISSMEGSWLRCSATVCSFTWTPANKYVLRLSDEVTIESDNGQKIFITPKAPSLLPVAELHYGSGVFEGIRAYETADGPAVFRLQEHIERLFRSAHILGMEIPYTVDEIVAATKETVKSTGLPGCYIRPIAYYGYGEMGLNTLPCTVDVAIACWPWGAYLGDDAMTKGVRMKISSWKRLDHNMLPPAAKTVANYANSSLAKVEALKAGYDEAILLNEAGLIADGSGENVFAVMNGKLYTPPISASFIWSRPNAKLA
mgnify:CR=1 FL=1